MPTIVVDTAADTIAADGKTSLREAIAQAGKMSGHVDIVFDTGTFYTTGASSSVAIQLDSTLTIVKGDIAIDGSLYYGGNSFGLKISGAGISTNAITVNAGATVTLRDLTIQGSSGNLLKAQYGADGHNGTNGAIGSPDFVDTSGTHGSPGTGLSGGHATDGANAPNDAEAGRDAVGAIVNRGTLTLERVDIKSFKTEGGAGGLGGLGGSGGRGGNGANGTDDGHGNPTGIPGDGGNGGNSGNGARGGDGGLAVGGIYNAGALTLRDVAFSGLTAKGGKGGAGGEGPNGGHGGNAGESDLLESIAVAYAGDGGNGGNGGNGGHGGTAAAALFNVGTVKWGGVQSAVGAASLTGGLGGNGGHGGDKGVRGLALSYPNSGGFENDPHHGHEGAFAGVNGVAGSNGGTGDFIGAGAIIGASFIVDTPRAVISEKASDIDRIVWIDVRLLGGSESATQSVKWEIVPGKGFSAADFESIGATPVLNGKLTFEGGVTGKSFGFRIAQDGKSEGIESFDIKLSDPKGGALGWSKSVTVYVTDGDEEGEAPTSIKLSKTSLNENTKTNSKVGDLSTKDGDDGDQFQYQLLDSAGGRFKLSGHSIKVADATKLDYEQSHSHTIKVRSTDLFGNSVDKKITITVKDVDSETIKGNASANKLFGGDGKDTIYGAGGNDTLKGGASADRFVFDSDLNASDNVDHIKDFKHGTDKIGLDKNIFTKLSGSKLADAAFYKGAEAHDNSDRIVYDKAHGKLYYDADGAKHHADPVLFAVIDTHTALGASDFMIV